MASKASAQPGTLHPIRYVVEGVPGLEVSASDWGAWDDAVSHVPATDRVTVRDEPNPAPKHDLYWLRAVLSAVRS